METVPADFIDGDFSEEDDSQEDKKTWGKMFPLGDNFAVVDLSKEEYTFGRGEDCDVPFKGSKKNYFQAYSKCHFKLIRKKTSTGIHIFLEDTSGNGTFVNGDKVGKGNRQVLVNNDEISLAVKKNKAFMFMDLSVNEDSSLPKAVRDKYTFAKTLGRGACGEVKLAFSKGSCERFAVKIISKKKFSVGGKSQINLSKQVMSEVKILKALKHGYTSDQQLRSFTDEKSQERRRNQPCIIRIEDVIDTPDTLYIVLEVVEGGELFDKIIGIGSYDEPTAKLIFYQMVCAVKYLHDQGITHRDLKPENILLSTDTKETLIKVTDFGLSKFVDAGSIMKTFCGTPTYLAPEILLTAGAGSYTKAIDCWSLGVILYICLVGYPPFSDERTDMDLPKQIKGGQYTFPKRYWEGISKDAIDLIRKMMTVDPKKRITLADALNHPWLKDEDMKKKANELMFPESDGMVPPIGKPTPPKKRGLEGADDPTPPKRKASSDTASPPSTP